MGSGSGGGVCVVCVTSQNDDKQPRTLRPQVLMGRANGVSGLLFVLNQYLRRTPKNSIADGRATAEE